MSDLTTYREAVLSGAASLRKCGVDSAEYDAKQLLLFAASIDDTEYLMRSGEPVPEEILAEYETFVLRRSKHEPLQLITGTAYFYGRPFAVNGDVLIPRFDTEVLVENALKVIRDGDAVLDMCTGSGCIIITVASERNLACAVGCDYSRKALAVARDNAARLIDDVRKRPEFLCGDLFGALNCICAQDAGTDKDMHEAGIVAKDEPKVGIVVKDMHEAGIVAKDEFKAENQHNGMQCLNIELYKHRFNCIISNPPYIESTEIDTLSDEVRLHDPLMALDGGDDGLEFYRRITKEAPDYLADGGYLFYEIGCGQAADVTELMIEEGFREVRTIKDLAGLDRVVFGHL